MAKFVGTRDVLGSEHFPSGLKKSTEKEPHACGYSLGPKSDWNLICGGQIGGSPKYRDRFDEIFGERCIKCRQKECRCE
jgi:hypothetical protein